ncbi:MAG: hypothetical protein KC457_23760 [Myxococcales bacterium]|nr:hypothetical protein [Myxococcales bacterium]
MMQLKRFAHQPILLAIFALGLGSACTEEPGEEFEDIEDPVAAAGDESEEPRATCFANCLNSSYVGGACSGTCQAFDQICVGSSSDLGYWTCNGVEKGSCPSANNFCAAPPNAALTYIRQVEGNCAQGPQVGFSAAGSSAGSAPIVQYRWDFDNNGTIDATTQSAWKNYSPIYGDRTACVTVVDASGLTDKACVFVNIC